MNEPDLPCVQPFVCSLDVGLKGFLLAALGAVAGSKTRLLDRRQPSVRYDCFSLCSALQLCGQSSKNCIHASNQEGKNSASAFFSVYVQVLASH